MPPLPPPPPAHRRSGWQRFSARAVVLFHAYGNWLVGITWMRFLLLSLLLLISAEILSKLPPFNLPIDSTEEVDPAEATEAAEAAQGRQQERAVGGRDREEGQRRPRRHDLDRQERGADLAARRSAPRRRGAAPPPRRHRRPRARQPKRGSGLGDVGVEIKLPPGADSEAVREAVEEARQAVVEAIRDSQQAVEEAAAEAAAEASKQSVTQIRRIRHTRLGDSFTDIAFLLIVASAILKISYKGTIQAEVKAARGDRDGRVGAAQAPGRRGAHGGDAGAGRAALPVQHAGVDRPPDRDRPAARQPDAEEPDRAAARLDAVDARVDADGAQPRPRDGGDPALPRDPEGAHGRAAADRHPGARRAAVGRVPVDDDPDRWSRTRSSTASSRRPRAAR